MKTEMPLCIRHVLFLEAQSDLKKKKRVIEVAK